MPESDFAKFLIKIMVISYLFIGCGINSISESEIFLEYISGEIPKGITNFKFSKKCQSADFKSPCTFYSKFNISNANFEEWVREIELLPVDSTFKKNVCKGDNYLYNIITSIKLRDYVSTDESKWWDNFDCDSQRVYGSLYFSSNKAIRIIRDEKWDGRVLVRYCEKRELCYLIIETFL